MRKLILTGFMGGGKTTVGKETARRSGIPFVDTDEKIVEKTGREISDIFAKEGEEFFRKLETEVLRELTAGKESLVIAVGGGLPMREENRRILKETGFVIYLRASADTLEMRLRGDSTRPLLQGGGLRERITGLLKAREGVYEQLADLIIDTDGKSVPEITQEIIANGYRGKF